MLAVHNSDFLAQQVYTLDAKAVLVLTRISKALSSIRP